MLAAQNWSSIAANIFVSLPQFGTVSFRVVMSGLAA